MPIGRTGQTCVSRSPVEVFSLCQIFIERVGRPTLIWGLVSQISRQSAQTLPRSCLKLCHHAKAEPSPGHTGGTTGLVSLFSCWCKAGMKPIKPTSENTERKKGQAWTLPSHTGICSWSWSGIILEMPLMWSLLSHCIPEEKTVPVSLSLLAVPPPRMPVPTR